MEKALTTQGGQGSKLYSWSYADDNFRPAHMITADEANRRSNSVTEGRNALILKKIEANIESAITVGSKTTSSVDMTDAVKEELHRLGYAVKYVGGDFREPSYYSISW